MVKKMRLKINFLNFLIYLVVFIIIARLYYLQVIRYDYYLEKLNKVTEKIVLGDTMPRGRIYDTNGKLLVDNRLVKTIYYKKEDNMTFKDEIELAYKVKDYLDLDYEKLTNSYLKDFYLLEHDDLITKRLGDDIITNHKRSD